MLTFQSARGPSGGNSANQQAEAAEASTDYKPGLLAGTHVTEGFLAQQQAEKTTVLGKVSYKLLEQTFNRKSSPYTFDCKSVNQILTREEEIVVEVSCLYSFSFSAERMKHNSHDFVTD